MAIIYTTIKLPLPFKLFPVPVIASVSFDYGEDKHIVLLPEETSCIYSLDNKSISYRLKGLYIENENEGERYMDNNDFELIKQSYSIHISFEDNDYVDAKNKPYSLDNISCDILNLEVGHMNEIFKFKL